MSNGTKKTHKKNTKHTSRSIGEKKKQRKHSQEHDRGGGEAQSEKIKSSMPRLAAPSWRASQRYPTSRACGHVTLKDTEHRSRRSPACGQRRWRRRRRRRRRRHDGRPARCSLCVCLVLRAIAVTLSKNTLDSGWVTLDKPLCFHK